MGLLPLLMAAVESSHYYCDIFCVDHENDNSDVYQMLHPTNAYNGQTVYRLLKISNIAIFRIHHCTRLKYDDTTLPTSFRYVLFSNSTAINQRSILCEPCRAA